MCMDAESRMRITFRIITSLSVNYPILRDWGFAPSRLLCIFTEKGMMQQLKNALFLKNAQVLNPYDGLKKLFQKPFRLLFFSYIRNLKIRILCWNFCKIIR